MVGDRPGAADAASEEYVGLLLRELEATISPTPSSGRGATSDEGPSSSSSLPSSIDPARIRAAGGLTSIFFGGGTPSLTPPHLVRRVIAALEAAFGLSPDAEVRGDECVCLFGARPPRMSSSGHPHTETPQH